LKEVRREARGDVCGWGEPFFEAWQGEVSHPLAASAETENASTATLEGIQPPAAARWMRLTGYLEGLS
jgi:hypothetical protein